MKRTQRTAPANPTRKPQAQPAWPGERHSGEGAASALEILQKLEKRRGDDRPAEPQGGDQSKA